MIDLELLECPACGGRLEEAEDGVKCAGCGACYPLRDGVLDFLPPPSHDCDP